MYRIKLLFCVFAVANLFATAGIGQLASKTKSADDCLMDYLLLSDEVGRSFCCRFRATTGAKYPDEKPPVVKDIYGISALSPDNKGEYFCWGSESLTSPKFGTHGIVWFEVLIANKKVRSKISVGTTPVPPRELSDDEAEEGKALSGFHRINFWGLPIGCEGMRGNCSTEALRRHFLGCELVEESVLENGDVVGHWVASTGYSVARIQFSAKQDFMPVSAVYSRWDTEEKKATRQFSDVRTTWKKTKSSYVTVAMKMLGKRKSKSEVEIDFKEIAFVPAERWEKVTINFENMGANPGMHWRDAFLPLFEEAGSK